uniref:Uncharacterized protein n=1 Tax=Aegilops tauschii subsp. strangulata TaxID=200361 RepID=A0A453MKJ1_AEGTS
TADTFQGVEFRWTSIENGGNDGKSRAQESLELSFDAEHTETALDKYVPFIMSTAEDLRLRDRALKIFLNESSSWRGINHHHPATFDTLAMDPAMKQATDEDGDVGARGYFQGRERNKMTLSGLLNVIDGLWSTTGEERIIVFTTNYKDRLDRALLRPGRMDMHVYMGHCGWEAFRTLARNYHLVDDHALFPEIQQLLAAVEVTPAEVSEMLLRSEDVDAALRVLMEFLKARRSKTNDKQNDGI